MSAGPAAAKLEYLFRLTGRPLNPTWDPSAIQTLSKSARWDLAKRIFARDQDEPEDAPPWRSILTENEAKDPKLSEAAALIKAGLATT